MSLKKLASFFGYESNFDSISSTSEISDEIDNRLSKFTSFSEFLSYKYYDETDQIFISDDSRNSVLINLTPLVGIKDSAHKQLENLLNKELPIDSHLTFTLIASSNINPHIELWKSTKNISNNIIRKIVSSREKFLSKKAVDYSTDSRIIPRNFKLYLSFTKKISNGSDLEEYKKFIQNLVQNLKNLSLHPKICNCNDLLEIASEIIEPDISLNKRKRKIYNPNEIISRQISTPLFMHNIKEDRIIHESSKLTSKFYFANSFPKEFSLEYMIKLLGDDTLFGNQIPGRFIISHSIAKNISPAESSSIMQKGNRIINSAEQWYSRNNRNIKREAREWFDVNDKAKNGEIFMTELFQIMLTSKSENIDAAEHNLLNLYNTLDWKLESNNYFALPSFLSFLPMQSYLYWRQLKFFMLTKIALSSEVAAKIPIHAEWRGVPKPGMILVGRRGQVFHWNPFYTLSSGNYNICIFGPSGSGKSVFLQDLAVNMIAQDTKIFILDIGKSFKNICSLLDGEIIEFTQNSEIALNPFYKFSHDLPDEDRNIAILYAKNIICSMSMASGDSLKESIIEKTIIKALSEFGSSIDITKFVELISKEDPNCEIRKNIALSLFSYTKDGLFGKFFANSSNKQEVSFEKNITIFEFEEIKNNNLLLSVVLQIIGMQIFMQFLTGSRDKKFMLIVDEAWMILDKSAKFLAEFARTIRKYGGSLAVCVQNYSDLEISDDRRAILQNSTWTILLKQDEKGISSFKESEAFKDIVPLIKTLSIQKNHFAEMLIYSTGIKVVGRLVLDKFSKILYSTDAEIFSSIRHLTNSGMSLEDAIAKIAGDQNE